MKIESAIRLARTERAQFLTQGLDLEAATGLPGAEWEAYQLAHLNDDGLFRHELKSRQVGFSWTSAAEAVANAILHPGTTSLFVSINREESAEKIRYARDVYEALFPSWRVPLVGDNITALAFANRSRIISMPQRPVRGKARAWVYLDEFAHYRLDKPIYIGTLPVTTKGGRIRIGSTAMGARGMFWEIGEQSTRPYPGYNRVKTPWWQVRALLASGKTVREASLRCPEMPTEVRVAEFASQRIKDIFENMPIDDFQQEYETAYIDEVAAYIPWSDIFACTADEDQLQHAWITKTAENAHLAIEEMAGAVDAGFIKGPLVWGLDIGRKRDLTELVIAEIAGRTVIVRAILSLDRQMFETQYGICRAMLEMLPIVRGYMDQNGLGMQLTEQLHLSDAYGDRAMPMPLTNPSKALMAQHAKTRFQRHGRAGSIWLPNDRDMKYQIHSIRRRISPGGNTVFDVESSERHHADKFWALALCVEAAETLARIEDYPAAANVTLMTARNLDALNPEVRAPEIDITEHGFGVGDLNAMLEHGVLAALPSMTIVQLPPYLRAALLPQGTPVQERLRGIVDGTHTETGPETGPDSPASGPVRADTTTSS